MSRWTSGRLLEESEATKLLWSEAVTKSRHTVVCAYRMNDTLPWISVAPREILIAVARTYRASPTRTHLLYTLSRGRLFCSLRRGEAH